MPHGRESAACQWARCGPSVPEFPLTLVIRGRGRDPRIPSYVSHTQSEAGADQAKFPPVLRRGWNVDEVLRGVGTQCRKLNM